MNYARRASNQWQKGAAVLVEKEMQIRTGM